ncbi:hypothetical protein L1987_71730 [Smallanthus sonchifolius]|uniref:Uncharacterized protein n=1 Tax=Smallanthus sonchifolius TaxID=185202 RepID=A0ACB9ATI2_9ASTR|nr:hypothetical protein L1987_71730 [Smallanthus sonchifolius]
MEINFSSLEHEEPMKLPPGFRFHPTDDELITHYLYRKACDDSFVSQAIGDVALNKFEPWDLPLKAKIGEKEWYFFCVRDRKYPSGLRTNRATEMGYWKATGKDREIYKAKTLVGMKKTLVFYKGRAPKGKKTNWVMHEFRLDGELAIKDLSKSAKGEWVISKVFEKTCGGKNIQISGVSNMNHDVYENEDEIDSSNLPPLMDISSSKRETIFHSIQEHKPKNQDFSQDFNKSIDYPHTQIVQNNEYLQYHDPSILKFVNDNDNRVNIPQNQKFELRNDQDYTMDLAGSVHLDWFWNY